MVATVNPIKELQPVIMTERGTITKIYGRAFVAGVLPFKVKHLLHVHTFTHVQEVMFPTGYSFLLGTIVTSFRT